MIKSFKCKDTEQIFKRERNKKFFFIQKIALRKLLQIFAANNLSDLKIPPGNRLEVLHGNKLGQYSIRINQQWRILIRFAEGETSKYRYQLKKYLNDNFLLTYRSTYFLSNG